MAPTPVRYRSSTSASSAPITSKSFDILRGLISKLPVKDANSATLQNKTTDDFPEIAPLLKTLRQIAQHVAASPSRVHQDDFRYADGFEKILGTVGKFSNYYNPQKRNESDMLSLFKVLGVCLNIISAALRDHSGNKRFFRHRVRDGGWEVLEQNIGSIGIARAEQDPWATCSLFGKLLAFCFDDEALDLLCQSIAKTLRPESEPTHNDEDEGTEEQWDLVLARSIESIGPSVREVVNNRSVVRHPEILRVVVSFWSAMPRSRDTTTSPGSLLVLETILSAVSTSIYNRAAIHSTGILSQLLRSAFGLDSATLSLPEHERVLSICRMLMFLGVNEPADTQFLLSAPRPEASEFCLEMAAKHTGPPFFHFDLSLHGYSSLEIPTMGRSFPPQSSAGYTFTAWIRIDEFDPNSHTTIFGAFDSTQTCFVLLYLEKDTRNLILQTSVFSNKPSVRFKSVSFQEKRWYHVAVVHRKQKVMGTSKASLFVDGQLAEQLRCGYPLAPPLSSGNESFASFNPTQQKTNPVQAFLGTPRDLSNHAGPGLIFSRWSLASAHLFEDALSDIYLSVQFGLGPRYQGNFQDRLGDFQTYEASASLGLRNEAVNRGKDDNSEILKAVRDKASTILPESKILLSILPSATFPENVQYLDTGLLRSLPRVAWRTLHRTANQEGATFAMNCALPSLTEALSRGQGVASFRGSLIVATPSYLDENLWRVAGFTGVALKLVARATGAEETVRTMELIFHCIRKSWRNSEAMERENGYAILGMLLRCKLGLAVSPIGESLAPKLLISSEERDKLAFQILSLVLGFVGYNHTEPKTSYIVNPLAYRILLIDLDIWRKSAPRIQELYYRQFIVFAVHSKHKDFNCRRLVRMRIVKKLLEAMKGESVSENVLQFFMDSFKALVVSNLSQEVMRSMSLFITYAFHTPPSSTARTPRPASVISRSSTPAPIRRPAFDMANGNSGTNARTAIKKQVGVEVLRMYTDILCARGELAHIKKFARTVTNKWLLYLLADEDPEVVVLGCKILARLLVTHGPAYTSKFASKSGGFTIMANKLKRFWDIPTLWPICFSILFGYDVAVIDFNADFEFDWLLQLFRGQKIATSESMTIVMSMLQQGLKEVMRHQDDPDSPAKIQDPSKDDTSASTGQHRNRSNSMELDHALKTRLTFNGDADRVSSQASILKTVTRFLQELHARSNHFRDFSLNEEWIRLLLSALYPAIVSTDALTPDTELNSRDSTLNFEGSDVIIRPLSGSSAPAPIVRTVNVNSPSPKTVPSKGTPLRRASSFVLLTAQTTDENHRPIRIHQPLTPKKMLSSQKPSCAIIDGILELVLDIFMDQLVNRKEFPGFHLFTKIPPGFQEHQAYFESYILRNAILHIDKFVRAEQKAICEPRILTNLGRLCLHLTEAIFEGWFLNGAEVVIDFIGMLLEFLQRPDIATLKSVRLCSQSISTIRRSLLRVILLRLSDLDSSQTAEVEAKAFMNNMAYWQMSILGCLGPDDDYLKLLWYQLYTKLTDSKESIRVSAANLLRVILVQKPEDSVALIQSCVPPDQWRISREFQKLTEMDDETFLAWVDKHRPSLDLIFFGGMSKTWEDFVQTENTHTATSAKNRLVRRKEKLKSWHAETISADKTLYSHDLGNSAWTKSIYNAEHFKYQRLMQDQQDDLAFVTAQYKKMERDLRRPGAVFSNGVSPQWKLDRTEGRNRMRLKLLPDYSTDRDSSKSRKSQSEGGTPALHIDTTADQKLPNAGNEVPLKSPTPSDMVDGSNDTAPTANTESALPQRRPSSATPHEDDFELIDDPSDAQDGDDSFEDKNRKVMRQLLHGDQVQAAFNISRITGLEACEGILIVGRDALYMMDNLFQCANSDIVNVWQAPAEERDPFTQVVTDSKTQAKRQNGGKRDQESRHWKWHDVISISKRRYLFRDVAIEVFFTDGRSYLMTTKNSSLRNDLFNKMMSKAPHTNAVSALPNPEDAWRLEALRVVDEAPQGFGSRIGTLFNTGPSNSIMKGWQKGEISNFHYLMMVNTMAGRTFNDLTQYPVFPWVLADYTSDHLDLDDPATFRDLSKPMGTQTSDRVTALIETYKALGEIGEKPYHYGTHYSSAMTVSSYLIRLPPFVHSYLLVQGDKFDHADRLFKSIPEAWESASRKNKTDVRELIPEFFCLPEFLVNINKYDFGRKQSSGNKVDHVELPPWAKGDPKLFIAKHREALESAYVSENLHKWIDLIFGYKQQGEAAVENINVFQPLSYAGAVDLDLITDETERAIRASMIHNFGQTPHQLFTKAHPPRDNVSSPYRRLDTGASLLACLPNPLLESHEKVASLVYAPKMDRLLCASPFRLNVPPYDKFLEWGFADNSIRFFFSDQRKVKHNYNLGNSRLTDTRKLAGLFENLHIGQISAACFADSKTLITAGEDCVVSVTTVQTAPGKLVNLEPKSSLFGHKKPVTIIAVSKALSTFITVSSDGQAFLWDLNQLSFIRKLPHIGTVECAKINDVSGEIMLASGQNIHLFTLNGDRILKKDVCEQDVDDSVQSCTFYEGCRNEWLENYLIFTGHRRGRVNIWRKSHNGRQWTLELVKQLDHIDRKNGGSKNTEAAITCITAMPTYLYTGDEDGRVVSVSWCANSKITY
ncbi:hypothetical protein S40285_07586 [Stachybotrys chlorohalonatus IBT 40285]|uniref:Beige protein homolog 1 n=1 Tax=Stachybotrys chlorohalonatus (strain IBT 40285) TaxID=1283841 RepID=A0A084Q9A0_STAC4|nr:hypothetical protein S40285_07586 [Stachybotrys chlorohalonata IBT 40285]